jgi:hypothetical protein
LTVIGPVRVAPFIDSFVRIGVEMVNPPASVGRSIRYWLAGWSYAVGNIATGSVWMPTSGLPGWSKGSEPVD